MLTVLSNLGFLPALKPTILAMAEPLEDDTVYQLTQELHRSESVCVCVCERDLALSNCVKSLTATVHRDLI